MRKFQSIADWLSTCPQLAQLWNISAEQIDGANVILPSGTSDTRTISAVEDVLGRHTVEVIPNDVVYEEYQINCYRAFAPNENDFNVLKIDDVQAVCDWIKSQDASLCFPSIEGETVIAVAPYPFTPQIRAIDPENGLIAYYITLRISYLNKATRRSVEYGC